MRVGFNTGYVLMSQNQMNVQEKLLEITKQLSSGKKIQFSNEGSTTFSESLRLEYDITTLTQSKKAAESAETFSNNTDTVLTQITNAMDQFKIKLVQAANEIQSDTSVAALADNLEAIRTNIMSLANTAVGEQYLFSGTAVSTKPFSTNGTYNGNDQELQSLVGSNNLLSYNITGSELFLGEDSNKNKIVTANVKHYNQELLNPTMMDPDITANQGEEVFITPDDPLRALLGDGDNDPTNDPDEWFYISGTKSDGTGFTEKFSMSPAYIDKESASTVQDLLDRIGVAFGNSSTNKVVDVSLNEWGEIEIKDLTKGSSKIDFHMVSARDPEGDVTDTDALISSGARVTEYIKSDYYSIPTATNAQAVQQDNDHRIFEIPSVLKRSDNTVATVTDSLDSIFPSDVTDLVLSGDQVNSGGTVPAAPPPYLTISTSGNTVQDLLDTIKQNFSQTGAPYDDIDVELVNGRIVVTDNTVQQLQSDVENPPYDGPSTFTLNIAGDDGTGLPGALTPTTAFSTDFSAEVDKVRFEKTGAYLNANQSQIVTSTNQYATDSTKLIEVSSPQRIDGSFEYSLDGKTLSMQLTDYNGNDYQVDINLATAGSTFQVTDLATGVTDGPFDLLQNYDSATATPADEVTYEQIMNVMEIGLSYSDANVGAVLNAGLPSNVEAYKSALQSAQNAIDVSLDYKGRFEVQDKTSAQSQIEMAMYDNDNTDFTATSNTFAKLDFHENDALVVDDPHIDFFDSLDEAIKAVRENIYRPDGYNQENDYDADPRNIGIQNSLTVFDHLNDHINRIHAKNGSQGNAFTYSIERNEIMITQTQTLKSYVLDADIADTSMQYSQLQLNYQAMLSTVSKLTKLSLVNYI